MENKVDDIVNTAYSDGTIHPQPCSLCGVVECAVCLDEVKKLLADAILQGRNEILLKRLVCAKPNHGNPLEYCSFCISDKLEKLAELEHEQWIHWSKTIIERLKDMESDEPDAFANALYALEDRWKPNWIPYAELSEEMKEHDRKWAKKVIEIMEKEE